MGCACYLGSKCATPVNSLPLSLIKNKVWDCSASVSAFSGWFYFVSLYFLSLRGWRLAEISEIECHHGGRFSLQKVSEKITT